MKFLDWPDPVSNPWSTVLEGGHANHYTTDTVSILWTNVWPWSRSVTISAWKWCSVCLYLQLFVGVLTSYLHYLYLFVYIGVQHTLCHVFVLLVFVFVCCMLPVSLDCPFLIAPLVSRCKFYPGPYVHLSHIFSLLNNLGSHLANHLKLIHQIKDLQRKTKFDFRPDHFFPSGVIPLCSWKQGIHGLIIKCTKLMECNKPINDLMA